MLMRLDRIIAEAKAATRSEASALIRRGSVVVNGKTAVSGAEKYDPEASEIKVNGNWIKYARFRYLMMNKPCGYVSATADRREKPVTVLLGEEFRHLGLFPAGRLDKDAEGLLILTNDGGFAHMVISPKSKVPKKYFVKIDGNITVDDIEVFKTGVTLGDGTLCAPALLENGAEPKSAYVSVTEGKYHQVKRMLASRGKRVQYLKRIAIGGLCLDGGLSPGEYRELSGAETESVFE